MNLNAVKDFKVLVVGDAIRDKYVFVNPLGRSIKDPIISVAFEREEVYRGGVWAAAAHLTDFCAQVDVIDGNRVMTNTRFIEGVYNRKLFTIHQSSEESGENITLEIKHYDLVIVIDFGHGTMSDSLIDKISKEARFLVVNAQTNSQNFGFNVITKYKRADYIVLDELEARLAVHDNHSPLEDIILALGYKKIVITRGANGAIGFDGEFHREPAIAKIIIDTMGAGDAFLCVSAPYAAARFSIRDLIRIGNAAGAVKLGILGHRKSVTKREVEALL